MSLRSKLFAGDRKLEAARVSDPAHLVPGTRGPHVAKVQLALFALDALPIDQTEFRQQTYGPVTARNVLAYKRRRKIINTAYQQAADDIVGKMTITRLDEEMVRWEWMHRPVDDCSLATRGSPAPPLQLVPSTRSFAAPVGAKGKPQFGGVLRVLFGITKRARLEDGFPIDKHIQVARDLLFEYGMSLSSEVREGFADTIDFAQSIVLDEDRALLRQAWEVVRPGIPGVLRVLVAQGSVNGDLGGTFRNVTVGSNTFPTFIVLNSRVQSANFHTTLIHEMIHAAYRMPELNHDKSASSVFFEHGTPKPDQPEQRVLEEDRARALSKAFFALGTR